MGIVTEVRTRGTLCSMQKRLLAVAYVAVGVAIALYSIAAPYLPFDRVDGQEAATIRAAKSASDLQARYARSSASSSAKPFKILIVPGHEPLYGGTTFRGIWEHEIVVDIADQLAAQLKTNPAFSVMVARTKTAWHPTLAQYFDANWEEIREWRDNNKLETAQKIAAGTFEEEAPSVHHNPAPEGPSIRLNGINKWADENDVDLVLHLHINDYPRSRAKEPGKYSGFSIYIPDSQYGNGAASRAVAEKIFTRLAEHYPVSNLKGESSGIVEELKLIAIGRDNSQSAASMLIEYGYIYEPQFTDDTLRAATVTDLAYQTFAGVQDFFNAPASHTYASTLLPHTWSTSLESGEENSLDVLALQSALTLEGHYPPPGNTLNECPRTGTFGPCTERALKLFQQASGIDGDGTVVGPATRALLNAHYGEKVGYQ
jgi:N-acetylmuramoyl-L-alanine amidase